MRDEIEKIIAKNGRTQSSLIHILQDIQSIYNYLPQEAIELIPAMSEITLSQITTVATFYRKFRLKKAGKHTIRVCTGTACYVKGAEAVYEAFCDYLHIPIGEDSDPEGIFTVEKVACLGCCMLAVAVQVDDVIYGWVEPTKVNEVVEDFLSSQYERAALQEGKKLQTKGEIRVCLCSSCMASGAMKVYEELRACATKYELPVRSMEVGCDGVSYRSPFMKIRDVDNNSFSYANVQAESVNAILFHHFKPKSLLKKALNYLNVAAYNFLDNNSGVYRHKIDDKMASEDCAYLQSQVRIATEFCGQMDPSSLKVYMQNSGFEAYEKALKMDRTWVINEIIDSNLRGRGGGGFPTGVKWNIVNSAVGDKKYLVCNADEGDPGAFMDRMLLESFPFRILEGIMIAMYAIDAECTFIYIREEYPIALRRIEQAILSLKEHGFKEEIRIVRGAGAFVCGEESALLASLAGRRGVPEYKPPFPAECGFDNMPTLINNVETFALVPWIIRNGAEEFSKYGTSSSRGTKTFALAGNIQRGGLIEIPMGISLNEIINRIGGGVPDNKKLKAVQVGGPSGGCVPESLCDLPVDYESLTEAGAIMGSGGLIVLDESNCMVDIARYFLEFTANESCGKCSCCRIGTIEMLRILNNLCAGKGQKGDVEKLEELALLVKSGSLCGLGRTAPNPVLSTLKFFRHEYEEHIEKKCSAKKCKELITYTINQDLCIGCSKCARVCGVEAILFKPYEKHFIEESKCDKCDMCRTVCPVGAVEVISG